MLLRIVLKLMQLVPRVIWFKGDNYTPIVAEMYADGWKMHAWGFSIILPDWMPWNGPTFLSVVWKSQLEDNIAGRYNAMNFPIMMYAMIQFMHGNFNLF